jgi:hypothetical protein
VAHIEINTPHPEFGAGTHQILINGIDYSLETYGDGVRLVSVGPDDFAEAGMRVTFCVSSLKINGEDVQIAGHLNEVSGRIKDLLEESVKA